MPSEILPPPARQVLSAFPDVFGGRMPEVLAIAPGRVNVIGEHIDYNDGFVLPAAIGFSVCVAAAPRRDGRVRVHSVSFGGTAEFGLAGLGRTGRLDPDWLNYPAGVFWALREDGFDLPGADLALAGDVPIASGLSSSAAVEVAVGTALIRLAGLDVPGRRLAQLAQRAENDFVGVSCGIMDQFISALAEPGHLMLLDCLSLEYDLVGVPANAVLVVGDTKASRSLAGSAYNERRSQCDDGLAVLRSRLPHVSGWRDVELADLDLLGTEGAGVLHGRARHVVTEIQRTRDAAVCLADGRLDQAGAHMIASHESLRDDYEVSSPALDRMVALMMSSPGCFGARLTGAGFGGCAVALVARGAEQDLADRLVREFPDAANPVPDVYVSEAAAGARAFGRGDW